MSAPAGYSLVMAALAVAACSSSPAAGGGGPPVPDPGGPFTASVAADRPIANLSVVEADTLCRDIGNVYDSFLTGAVQVVPLCRDVATSATSEERFRSDGGIDAGAICAEVYAECTQAQPRSDYFRCPIPVSGHVAAPCDATVGDLSACLNEIASFDPVAICVTKPGCDGGGSTDASPPPPSAMPACERLYRICPALHVEGAVFPC